MADSTAATWSRVDRYLDDTLRLQDEVLAAALDEARTAGLPPINVSAAQGKLLQVLARSVGARRILEIGTLGGYSAIWMGRALPDDGRLITLELDPHHAAIARRNVARAGLANRVEIRVGPALELLPQLAGSPPFDFVFIDADKPNIPAYFDWSVRLARPGALILVDNVVRDGALADSGSTDANVLGVRALHQQVLDDTRVDATTIQTVGAKGYDGFLLAVVRGR